MCQSVLQFTPPPARVLDLGTGSAFVPSTLACIGYEAWGVDDYSDPGTQPEVLDGIMAFAESCDAHIARDNMFTWDPPGPFDAVVSIDVVEHLHDSPRLFTNRCGSLLRANGLVVVSMPNSVNLRKRLDVLRGRSNYVPLDQFFESLPPWRGHVREFTPAEGSQLLRLAGFVPIATRCFTAIALDRSLSTVQRVVANACFKLAPSTMDSFISIGRRPPSWSAVDPGSPPSSG